MVYNHKEVKYPERQDEYKEYYALNKESMKKRARDWYYENKEQSIESSMQWDRTHPDMVSDRNRIYYLRLKLAAMTHYSINGVIQCACCGERNIGFLSIDHMNNNGTKHRKQVGGGAGLYRWLRDNSYPNGFQLLCFNCNSGRGFNKNICPHKQITNIEDEIRELESKYNYKTMECKRLELI